MPSKNNQDYIKIRGARVHNLRSIDLDIPKNKLVVVCGVSGSGKSSLAFDTLYAEGQRRYVESLSSYARQFLGVMEKPDVDKIEGISPAIAIDQRKSNNNPRSTVGTMTEIYDYLRVLFARIGQPYCPQCGKLVQSQTIDQIVKQILKLPKQSELLVLGPAIKDKKGEHKAIIDEIKRAGFVRVRVDGIITRVEEAENQALDEKKKHSIEVVVDRLVLNGELERSRLVDSIETALKLGKGTVIINSKSEYLNPKQIQNLSADRQDSKFQVQNENKNKKINERDLLFSEKFACEECGVSMPEIEPRLFSFNSPQGACSACQGLGKKLEIDPELVIPNKNLSLAEGAVFPWARASHKVGRQGWYFRILEGLASNNDFSLNTPVKDLSKEQLALVLYGDKFGFEGVIPNLERRFWQTESEGARVEIKKYMRERQCEVCSGKRLKKEVLAVKIKKKSINDVVGMPLNKAKDFFSNLTSSVLNDRTKLKSDVALPLLKEIIERLGFLIDVGVDYLTLSRETETLSGGEEQRARLATQIGSKLTGVLYILDEPSVGLHQRDQERLIKTLKDLRDVGNTVIVVEHDPQTIAGADWVIEIGPKAGKHGGKVVFTGTPKQLLKADTLTGKYLSVKNSKSEYLNPKQIQNSKFQIQNQEAKTKQKFLFIKGASENNLKNIDVKIPLGKFVCVTGVSGSGKSSLVNDIIGKTLFQKFYRSKEEPGKHKKIEGTEFLDKVVLVDQSPIGRTPRSNPATYTGAFNHIRALFSNLKEARIRGYKQGRFSFNVKGGRCEACEGQGQNKIEMYFLPDVYIKCPECSGKRYNQETLEVKYQNKSIADILEMTVEDGLQFFKHISAVQDKLKTLNEVGLGYLELGQSAPSLSGGEAQRIKLAAELSKKSTGKTLYILDEPTTGLHPYDIEKLLYVLKELVNKGNSVLTIEHNLDFIKSADWLIDLGPEGGDKGGEVVAVGSPEELLQNKRSYTAQFLNQVLNNR
ncbi:MAG: excinuclease ABC subunit UvrA [Candidatus Omnitrophota bacterium]|nr:excinuclease ABC subunit UvrA [Candidatus Omnitrophota bacterium]